MDFIFKQKLVLLYNRLHRVFIQFLFCFATLFIFALVQLKTLKMKTFFFSFVALGFLVASCGKSIDKNSFEGRVASLVSDFEGINMAISMDLKSVVEKSGIKDGAIPEQYMASIEPFLDAMYSSINMEKQIFVAPIVDYTNVDRSGAVVLFDVKDVERLKKEYKEMGFTLSKKGDAEYAVRGREATGIFKNQTGFIIMSDSGSKLDDTYITQITKSLGAGKTVEGVVDFVNLKSDVTMFFTGDKAQKMEQSGVAEIDNMVKNMSEISKGTYWIGQMAFNKQEAVMTMDVTYGKNMKKYMPLMNDAMSDEGKAVLVDENTIFAYAMSAKFEQMIDMILDNMDDKTKDEMNKGLSMVGGTDKFKKMLTGEFAISMSVDGEKPNVAAFLGVGDKKQFQSLLDGFGFFLGLQKSGDGYQMDENFLQFTDKGLLFAMNKANVDKMKSKKSAKNRKLGDYKFGAAPMSMFVDFKKMTNIKETEDYAEAFKDFDYMTMEFTNEGGKAVMMSNKSNQNILRTLVEAVIEMQRLDQIRQEKQDQEWAEMYGEFDEAEWAEEDWAEEDWNY